MAFIEIEKTRPQTGKYGAPATFTRTKKGVGSLRINSRAVEHLKEKGKNWELGDMVRIFHDPETGRLALTKSPDGKFRLAKNVSGSNSLRISSKDLTELIKKPASYEIQESGEYDLVLQPMR